MQVFLQGKLQGIDSFLTESVCDWDTFAGRCLFLSLAGEAIPRALLSHLGLAPTLLGSSGGGQFLVLLTEESLTAANDFLVGATRSLQQATAGRVRLAWASTEEVGAWPDVRKRLDAAMQRWRGLNALEPQDVFAPYTPEDALPGDGPWRELYRAMSGEKGALWAPESPGLLAPGGDPLPLAVHSAPTESGTEPASPAELGRRAVGLPKWGVLRGDADRFSSRLAGAQSVHDHLQCAVFYRQFFAGEIQVLCTQGEFWQKVSVLYTGGDDFAVFGAWDSLIPFAREIQRLFHRSVSEYLKEFPGPEGKSISMAIALAPSPDTPLADVYAEAGRLLGIAKAEGRDRIHLFGRLVDWKELAEAGELRQTMVRLVEEFGCTPQFLSELAVFYRETDQALPGRGARQRVERQGRPWRFYRRLSRVLEAQARRREFQKARQNLFTEFLGRNQAQIRLKPAGRVALEWARLAQESETS